MKSINLLPGDLAREEKQRQRLFIFVAIAVGYVALLALVAVWRQGGVNNAEDDVAQQRQINEAVQTDINGLADAELTLAAFQTEVAKLNIALENDVSWATLLNDLGRLIPDQVWLSTLSATAASVGTAEGEEPAPSSRGTLSITGVAFNEVAVANWLRALDSDRFASVGATWVTTLSAGAIGEVPVINFTSSVELGPASNTRRLDERTPGVPL
jgi:Tfp pilus assembly protein PilN